MSRYTGDMDTILDPPVQATPTTPDPIALAQRLMEVFTQARATRRVAVDAMNIAHILASRLPD